MLYGPADISSSGFPKILRDIPTFLFRSTRRTASSDAAIWSHDPRCGSNVSYRPRVEEAPPRTPAIEG
jgi:hypothetical protein